MFLPARLFPNESENYFTGLEYGLIAEILGRSTLAPEATNCAAPDTGNMELLAKYGTQKQKDQWLRPLLEGQIRSSFMMTEPDVASSDAKNIELDMKKSDDGKFWIINGRKWIQSGVADPRTKIYIVFGRSNPENDKANQHSVVLVPKDTPGITIKRIMSVYGYDDLPHSHGDVTFKDVRVPYENLIVGEVSHSVSALETRIH